MVVYIVKEKTMIATFVGNDHRDWDKHIHEFSNAVNTAAQATNKVYPAFLNFGRQSLPVKSLRREVEQITPLICGWIDSKDWMRCVTLLSVILARVQTNRPSIIIGINVLLRFM